MAAPMDWTYPAESNEAGIFEIGRRLAASLGRVPDVTRFEYDPREMLKMTRQCEHAARGNRLFTGFQTAAKLEAEISRYAALIEEGTKITVFATGAKPKDQRLKSLKYRELVPSTRELANQWFLVTDGPEPLAFLSYEIGNEKLFGHGGAATKGKRFVGFITDDKAVVRLMIKSLTEAPTIESEPQTPAASISAEVRALVVAISRSKKADAKLPAGSVIVAIGRGVDRGAFLRGAAIARDANRKLVLIDRSAEGFSSPYGDMRGDDASKPARNKLFDERVARREGRNNLADYLEAARIAQVDAGGWFPTKSGGEGILVAVQTFKGSVVVVPADAAKPGLAERLRGMSVADLRKNLDCGVIVAS
jgi:hypothetical protein